MARGKLRQAVDHVLHPHAEEGQEQAMQQEDSAEANAEPQSGKPKKADPKKDYAAHPKFAKFKGEGK